MKIGIIIHPDKTIEEGVLQEACRRLLARGTDVWMPAGGPTLPGVQLGATEAEVIRHSDFILSLGGDGTLLSVARAVGNTQKPILGVNIGKLGFLTGVEIRDLDRALDRLASGDYVRDERLALRADVGGSQTVFALNDIVISRSHSARMIRIHVQVNGRFLNRYTADGLIVSTPTGSTAYSMSANGPILTPSMDALVLNPICPHTLTMRPLVISGQDRIDIMIEEGQVGLLSADSQEEIQIRGGADIRVRKADHTVHLIRFSENDFYSVLRGKLHWGEDARGG